MSVSRLIGIALVAGLALAPAQAPIPDALDKAAAKWVDDTIKRMALDDLVGQLVFTSANSTYLASDTDAYDALAQKIRTLHLGGVHLFGGAEPAAALLLNQNAGGTTLGDPLAAASLTNRLQNESPLPLLVSADFEAGLGFRLAGATTFPREMAVGAAGDERLAFEAARITGAESRAIGVHVNFSPVADVNNNPQNPVINTRSFGESPDAVGRLASAYVRGLRAGGALATLKHFPGHGDTDVDSHLGLPIIGHPRERLDRIELAPFRQGLAAGADAVMVAHIELPALDPGEFSPATLSPPIVTGLLRGEMKFQGLIFTDSMGMDAIARRLSPADAAVRAIQAGNDVVLHSPDDAAAVAAVKAAVEAGKIPRAQVEASVRRLLQAKARLGLHKTRTVSLDDVPKRVGGRQNAVVAQQLSEKSITLVKDDRNQVPLRVPREASVLYLSMLDYPANWRIAAPSRTFLPELRKRWPIGASIELSDRSTTEELELVRATATRYDAIVVSVFVRASSGSGRMDLAAPLAKLLTDLARLTSGTPRPFITVFFGNPYVPAGIPTLPAVLLTYDFYDLAELSAIRGLAGDSPLTGRLPVSIPGIASVGFGIERSR
ncbi:MAG TPA: glycoside hydrolase family 3 protein [Vicinamibacterales bacterium]|nr:glycoside hydrolase family 3 protein [Vicinamibacterales bacterium]